MAESQFNVKYDPKSNVTVFTCSPTSRLIIKSAANCNLDTGVEFDPAAKAMNFACDILPRQQYPVILGSSTSPFEVIYTKQITFIKADIDAVAFNPIRTVNDSTSSNAFTQWSMTNASNQNTGFRITLNGRQASSVSGGPNASIIQNVGGDLHIGNVSSNRVLSLFAKGPLSNAVCIGVTADTASTLIAGDRSNISNYRLVVNGNAWSTGWRTVSDSNLKDDVCTLGNCLERIRKISGYTYKIRSAEDGKRCVGVMAQDVETVLPEAVDVLHDGSRVLDYNGVVTLLVEAVKELDRKIVS